MSEDHTSPYRRRVLALFGGCIAWIRAPGTGFAQQVQKTPAQTEGPYYPTPSMRFADQDNDLVRIASAVREAGGEIIHLTGRVFTTNGEAAVGARVEIWQVDNNGRYLHSRERGPPREIRIFRALDLRLQMKPDFIHFVRSSRWPIQGAPRISMPGSFMQNRS
ncbi:dioxygenase family protein [Pseudogemmobacter bohemicus]|uniref:dioxygenase family protein n=1 Tax=Pseudogemmobacter bohemicus TaxID=2250708 RepID=UPI0013001B02|nr:hypothetical protein [Pseudogemmobacter bohemicus]